MPAQIDFVDALGHVAYAEELDVRVEPYVEQDAPPLPQAADIDAPGTEGANSAAEEATAPTAAPPAEATGQEDASVSGDAGIATSESVDGASTTPEAGGDKAASSIDPAAEFGIAVPGEERMVIGQKPVLVRSAVVLDSPEIAKIAPGTLVRVLESRKTVDGVRSRVRVVSTGLKAKDRASEGAEGWITAVQKGGKERLARPHRKMEANERRLQTELWNKRLAADRALVAMQNKASEVAERALALAAKAGSPADAAAAVAAASASTAGRALVSMASSTTAGRAVQSMATASGVSDDDSNSLEALSRVGPSFAHELYDDRRGIAFAYGGVYPGTLHAHGALVKTHAVSYSIGAAGRYLLHVGLRQKAAALPGSPFIIDVKPGAAHAPSTQLPPAMLPLRSVVGKGGDLVLRLSDNCGNECIEGGAALQVSVNTEGMKVKCADLGDGTYNITWKGTKAGDFQLSATLQGAHIRGSPAPLTMLAAEPDVNKCELLGDGVNAAIAGVPAKLEVRCRDAYGNDAEPTEGMRFGLVLIAMHSNDKSKAEKRSTEDGEGKAEKKPGKMTAAERASLVRTQPSMEFEGKWEETVYSLEYIPRDAGVFELHFWCDPAGDGTRAFLPGCPFSLQVNAGHAAATGSSIRDSATLTAFTAGDRLVLKVQTRDEFQNNAALVAPDEELSAELETPNGTVPLILKAHTDARHAVHSADGEGGGGAPQRNLSKKELQKAKAAAAEQIGAYELVTQGELTLKGEHTAFINLHGAPIKGSPLQFAVRPAAPVASKSYLVPPPHPSAHVPVEVLLQLVDKYGNDVERGEVRVDAKAFGPKASECQVIDCENGTYTITFTASVPGDYKVQVRLENTEMAPCHINIAQRDASEATAGDPVSAAAPGTEAPFVGSPAVAAGVAAEEPMRPAAEQQGELNKTKPMSNYQTVATTEPAAAMRPRKDSSEDLAGPTKSPGQSEKPSDSSPNKPSASSPNKSPNKLTNKPPAQAKARRPNEPAAPEPAPNSAAPVEAAPAVAAVSDPSKTGKSPGKSASLKAKPPAANSQKDEAAVTLTLSDDATASPETDGPEAAAAAPVPTSAPKSVKKKSARKKKKDAKSDKKKGGKK